MDQDELRRTLANRNNLPVKLASKVVRQEELVGDIFGFRVWEYYDEELYSIQSTRGIPWRKDNRSLCDHWPELKKGLSLCSR